MFRCQTTKTIGAGYALVACTHPAKFSIFRPGEPPLYCCQFCVRPWRKVAKQPHSRVSVEKLGSP